MDNQTLVEQIAEQLGIAADAAGAFVAEQLPGYAALMASYKAIDLAIAGTVAAALIVLICIAGRLVYIDTKDEMDGMKSFVFVICAACIAVVLMFAGLLTAPVICEMNGWLNYPEAQFLKEAMELVK